VDKNRIEAVNRLGRVQIRPAESSYHYKHMLTLILILTALCYLVAVDGRSAGQS
jgi:hypothetical protein